jgi:hypothetical protein
MSSVIATTTASTSIRVLTAYVQNVADAQAVARVSGNAVVRSWRACGRFKEDAEEAHRFSYLPDSDWETMVLTGRLIRIEPKATILLQACVEESPREESHDAQKREENEKAVG